MQRILKVFKPFLEVSYRHPLLVIIATLLLASVSGWYALKLTIDTDLANLLPEDHIRVQALERLQETVGGETPVQVVVNSPSFEANKEFAEALIPRMMDLYDDRLEAPFFDGYEFRRETDILKDNALYLASDQELDDIIAYLEDEIEYARLKANPFFVDFEEDFEDEDEEDDLERFRRAYDELIPSEYPVSSDSTALILEFFPTGSRADLTFVRDVFEASDRTIAEVDPASFHPEMQAEAGGRLKRHKQEIDFIISDVQNSLGSGMGSVILLVTLYFFFKTWLNYRRGNLSNMHYPFFSHVLRIPIPPLVIVIPLLISLSFTFGLTYLLVGTLNTMTSVLFVILFGLSIDYGIHYYARYIERRAEGATIREAIFNTYFTTGSAILTSALTTAVALFVLIIADFRGFSEFGAISGTGILLGCLAMLLLLPAMLILFERYRLLLINPAEYKGEETPLQKSADDFRYPVPRVIVLIGIAIVGFVLFQTDKISFEYDFGTLEPEFEEYREFRERMGDYRESDRRNPAYILADSDEEVYALLNKLRTMKEENPDTKILDVEALQERFPSSPDEEQDKLSRIETVRELLDDEYIRDEEGEDLDMLRRAAQTTEPLAIEDVPDFMKDRFLTRDGEIGRFVMVYPNVGLSDGRNSIAFKNEIGELEIDGKVFYAASTSLIAAEMLELLQTEAPYMVTATFIMVFALVWFAFGSLKWTLIALIPLLMGFAWTFAVMIIFGMTLNFYNMVVLPAILGIGNDNGVHIASRYREEGRGSLRRVLSSTGQHITIGSLTTMLGFAGLILTTHPGLQSIGTLAVIGIGLTLLSGLIFAPALIQWLEDRGWV